MRGLTTSWNTALRRLATKTCLMCCSRTNRPGPEPSSLLIMGESGLSMSGREQDHHWRVPKMRHQEKRTFFVALSCSITNAASCQTLATIGKTCVRR